jgi:hypothetical protein
MRYLYRLLSIAGTFKAARRGPGSLGRRQGRRVANRHFNRLLRKVLKP